MSSGGFLGVLRSNRNYRFTWTGQVVSEIGDHFNNIAVFSLALANTGSGLAVAGILLARGMAVMLGGPISGVLLDRMDRRRIMILSDLVRAAVAIGFIFAIPAGRTWLLFLLSALLMFASPFFTSGRASILPSIASRDELHSANSLTQLTQWSTVTIGSFLGGASVTAFGYKLAFVFNAASFVFSALCISRLSVAEGFRPQRSSLPGHSPEPSAGVSPERTDSVTEPRPSGSGTKYFPLRLFPALRRPPEPQRSDLSEDKVIRPWHEYKEGLRYMRSSPLIFGIGLVAVGWATGGGAAQILFSLFGEVVFRRGPSGIGVIWGCAGIGLIVGAIVAHRIGPRLSFNGYKRTISICYVIHGATYVLFSQATAFPWALVFIGLSRGAVAVSSVLNFGHLLRHVSPDFRGRVFSTIETWTWMTMMVSMSLAGFASTSVNPRIIGAVSGVLSSTTAIFWAWASYTGRLPEPALAGVEPEEVEVHGDPTV